MITAAATMDKRKGFMTILIGLYSFQDCIHFLASVRRFHREPIVILIDQVPRLLWPLLQAFGNVQLVAAPRHENPVLSSRLAKLALYGSSPFEKTLYLDADICLLAPIDEVFEALDRASILVTQDVQPSILEASNLVRDGRPVLPTLQAAGLPVTEQSIQYNGGFLGFRRSAQTEAFFDSFRHYFEVVCANQESLQLKDQGAFASAMATVQPEIEVLPPIYNFLDKWRRAYGDIDPATIKVLHCTYPYRPQYAKDISRSLYTRLFDRIAHRILPNQTQNQWRSSKAQALTSE
jgi:hypothetical protein